MTLRVYTESITELEPHQIFVFGSNPQGWHSKGAALTAKTKFGAVQGQGRGFQGQSYGLITKNLRTGLWDGREYHKAGPRSISKPDIIANIKELYQIAKLHPELEFWIAYTRRGRNLNGYSAREMASMFAGTGEPSAPDNIVFESEFLEMLQS